jgi:hypothetical protein
MPYLPIRVYRNQQGLGEMAGVASLADYFTVLDFLNEPGDMSFKLVLFSTLIGVIAGLLTIYAIPVEYEIAVWILLTLAISYIAVNNFKWQVFKRTFVLALLSAISITVIHILLADDYARSHTAELAELKKLLPIETLELLMAITAPFYWILLGLCAGFCASAMRKFRLG